MNLFRLLGYVFLIGGLISVEWKQFEARQIIMSPVVEQWHQMSDGQSYDRVYVRDAVEKAAEEVWNKTAPWFFGPALIMLIGGVLLDIGARRKRDRKQQPNKPLQPRATAPSVSTN